MTCQMTTYRFHEIIFIQLLKPFPSSDLTIDFLSDSWRWYSSWFKFKGIVTQNPDRTSLKEVGRLIQFVMLFTNVMLNGCETMWKESPHLMENEKCHLKLENIAHEQCRHLHGNQKFARKKKCFWDPILLPWTVSMTLKLTCHINWWIIWWLST